MTQILIIAAASRKDAANAQFHALGLDPSQADNLTVPLFPVGQTTPTHYWCSWLMDAEAREKVKGMVGVDVFEYDTEADPGFPQRKLEELGLETQRMILP